MAGSGLDYDSQITKFMNQSGINQQKKVNCRSMVLW